MKLFKSLSRANFGTKNTDTLEDEKDKEDSKRPSSGTDLTSPTKSADNSKKSLKIKASAGPEPPNPELDIDNEFMSPSGTKRKKKKGRKSKRISSDMAPDSVRSVISKSERGSTRTSTRTSTRSLTTPKNKKGKPKKKKKGKGNSSRRSEASAVRQSILMTPPEHEEMEHTSVGDREEGEGEAWLGNFGPHQAISATLGPGAMPTLGPGPMPDLDERDEHDLPEEKSMRSGILELGIPPNPDQDPMNDSKVSLADSYVMEVPPPIGELVVGGNGEDVDDDVSDMGEPTVASDTEGARRSSMQSNMAPEDEAICFQDRGHPGTRFMTKVIRNLLEENEDAKYTQTMAKLIRRKLKGRKFLVMERQNEEVFWRQAEKKELNKLMAEFFKEERRRKETGVVDDDSDMNSSLQDSARQSNTDKSDDASMQLEELNDDAPPPPAPSFEDSQRNKPPTPKMNNSNHRKRVNENSPVREELKEKLTSAVSTGEETTSELLSQITEQRKNAEDYALPFNSYEMMENGRKAEDKLQSMLRKVKELDSRTQDSDDLRLEIHKMDLLVERVMYASIGPLLEMLERMDDAMNELADELAERDIELSPPRRNPKLQNPATPQNTAARGSGAMRKSRTVVGDSSHNDSQGSLNSPSSFTKTDRSRTIRSGSKRSRESKNQALNHDSATSFASASRRSRKASNHDSANSFASGTGSRKSRNSHNSRNLDQEGHPRGRSFLNESRLQASGVSMFDDEISNVPQAEIRIPQLSEPELNYVNEYDNGDDDDFDEEMEDETEVEIPLNDEGGYESLAESSGGYSGSREKSSHDGDGHSNSNGTGASFGIDEWDQHLNMGKQQYTIPLKGGSSGQLSSSASFSSDAMTPSKSYSGSNSFRHSFASIDENRSHGSQSLRMHQVFQSGGPDGSFGSIKSGKVVEVSENERRKSDDMSSIGNSQRRLQGSDSEEEFQDMEISDAEDNDERVMSADSDDSDGSLENEKSSVSVKSRTVGATKLEQFFDRLQHFFEVRRKVEERADIIDPSGKCRRMKMRCPTKLVPKTNGEYGSAYQQQNMHGEVVTSLDELYTTAERARPALHKVLDHLTDDIMGLDMQSVQLADLKPRDRAFEKAKEEFSDRRPGPPESWLCDVVRASVICKSYKQMNDVNKWIQKNCDIVKGKNRFLDPTFNGYRDLLFHISMPYDGTMVHICEIQVHHRDMNALDRQFGMPKHYEFFRSSFAGPWRCQEDVLDDLALMNKHGDVGAMMVKLLRCKDPDQLRLFARLCREKLDEFDKALELYRRILVLQSKDNGKQDHETTADTHMNIGLVYGNKGEIDESLYHLQQALEIQEEGAGTDNAQGAELMTEIGRMLSKKGDFEGALANFEQALEIRENAFGNEHFMVISSLQDIGQAFGDMGDYAASEVSYRKALKLQEKMLNDVHPDIATTSRLIGITLCKYGDFGTAMELHRLALSIRETSLGKNHPMTAESQTDIGIVLCQKGDLENAEWRHRKALRIRELKGKEDEDCAISLSYLGDVLSRKGDYAGAIKLVKRAQRIREDELGLDHPVTAGTYIDLGNVYYKQGDANLALKEYRRAKVARESMFGPDHQETAVALSCLGNALNLQGDYQAAHNAHMQALDIYAHFLGEGHPLTATGYQNIADTLLLMGGKEKALIQHRKALAIRANVLSKDHPDTALSCSRIGDLLAEKDDLVGALVAHKQALAITLGLSGEDTIASAKAHIHVGLVLAAQGEFEQAIDEFDQATTVLEKILGNNHEETARAYALIGSVHSARGDFEDAYEMHAQALEVFENLFGPQHPKTMAASNKCKRAKKQIAETEF